MKNSANKNLCPQFPPNALSQKAALLVMVGVLNGASHVQAATVTYGSGTIREEGTSATGIVLSSGAVVLLESDPPGTPVLKGEGGQAPTVRLEGTSTLSLQSSNEIIAGLDSNSAGARIDANGNDLDVHLEDGASHQYKGRVDLEGGILAISAPVGEGDIAFVGNGAPMIVAGGGLLNGRIDPAKFVVDEGAKVTTGTEVLDRDASVEVSGDWETNGEQTITDLLVTGDGTDGGNVTVVGKLTILDALKIQSGGSLDLTDGELDVDQIDVGPGSELVLDNSTLPDDSKIVVDGTVRVIGENQIGCLAGGPDGEIVFQGEMPILVVREGDFDGEITGPGDLVKDGPGTLTLDGDHTYTGDTKVREGTLEVNGTLASANVEVCGGELILGGPELLNDDATLGLDEGRIVLNGDETVKVANLGEGVVEGTGVLKADDINLGGAEIGVALEADRIATMGEGTSTTLSEPVKAGAVTVTGNTELIAEGVIDSDEIKVEENGKFKVGEGGSLNDTANVTVDGGLELCHDETIATLMGGTTGAVDLNDYTLTLNQGGNFGGVMSGTGGLVTNDDLTLSGRNSYTGDTTINSGHLTLSGSVDSGIVNIGADATAALSGADSIADTATVNLAGQMTVNNNERIGLLNGGGLASVAPGAVLSLSGGDFTGTISGAGGLEKYGPEDFCLLNGSSYTGPTTVSEGALKVGGTMASLVYEIADQALLETKGPEVLSNNALVNANGTFRMGGKETIRELNGRGNVENGGYVLAVQTGSFGGDISGAGGLTKNGPGSFTLSGDNRYTGETLVNGGKLAVEGSIASTLLTIRNGAEFCATVPNVLMNGTVVTANGGFRVVDETIQTLNGNGDVWADDLTVRDGLFDGGMDISDQFTVTGNFTNNGHLGANKMIVGPDAVLGLGGTYDYGRLEGTGRIVASNFVNRGTIAPGGDGVGTLTIDGNYVEEGTYEVTTRNGNSDQLVVLGSVHLDDELAVLKVEENGTTAEALGWKSLIVNTESEITGGYADLVTTGDSNLRFDTGSGNLVSLGKQGDFDALGTNERAILDAILLDGGDGVNIDTRTTEGMRISDLILNPGADGLEDALARVSPATYGGAADLAMHSTRSFMQAARTAPGVASAGQRQAPIYSPDSTKGGLEEPIPYGSLDGDFYDMEVFGGYNDYSIESEGSSAYRLNGGGGYAGLRLNTTDKRFQVGAFLGVEDNSIDSSGFDLDGDGLILGGYASARPLADGRLRLWSELAFGDYSFSGSHLASHASFDASSFQAGLGTDYLLYGDNGVRITPGLGLRYSQGKVDAFSETGSAGSLVVNDIDRDSLWLDVGLDLAYQPLDSRIGLSAYVGYQAGLNDSDDFVTAGFAGGSTFDVLDGGIGSGALIYNVGAHYDFTDDLQIGATFRAEFREDTEDYKGFNIQATYGF